MKYFLSVLLLLFGCGKPSDKPEPEDPRMEVEARYEEAYQRLSSRFLEKGWIVSRNPDGTPKHIGDSLIWSGTFLSVAKCEDTVVERNLINTIMAHDGALVRYATSKEVSLDGALGLYRGIVSRMVRCPNASADWDLAVTLHRQYLFSNDFSLNTNSDAALPAGFTILPEVVAGYKNESTGPLLAQLVVWAAAVNTTKSAAFRINLAYLVIQTLEDAGYEIPDIYRSGFCRATAGVDIPTVDHWCGRGDLGRWIDEFEFNVWEYRHQRSGAWEKPDGAGVETPGLDFLVAVRQFYK